MKLVKGKFIGKASIIMGILSFIYFIVARCYAITFANFFAIFGVTLILFGLFEMFGDKKVIKQRFPWIWYLATGIFWILLVSVLIIESLVIYNGTKKDNGKADYVVILGAMVRGETPSLILSKRLEAGLDYIKKNPEIKVVLSGGKGNGEDISEAEAMKRYFVSHGVEETRLIKEDKSTSTMENLKFTNDIIKKLDNRENINLLIVTSDSHMFRAKFLAKRNGFKPLGIPANTPLSIKPTYYIYEYFAVIKSFLLDKNDKKTSVNKTNVVLNIKDKDIKTKAIGDEMDSYKGVAVYNNGKDYVQNYGKNYSKDGYYYGYKWQCVEFIKRFYYDALAHKMPDGYGNAKDFFDISLKDGGFNKKRGLLQFENGGKTKPKIDDLVVFNDTKYGHVGIITEVGSDYIEIIQQNIYEKPRMRIGLYEKDGSYFVEDPREPAGWLRK